MFVSTTIRLIPSTTCQFSPQVKKSEEEEKASQKLKGTVSSSSSSFLPFSSSTSAGAIFGSQKNPLSLSLTPASLTTSSSVLSPPPLPLPIARSFPVRRERKRRWGSSSASGFCCWVVGRNGGREGRGSEQGNSILLEEKRG